MIKTSLLMGYPIYLQCGDFWVNIQYRLPLIGYLNQNLHNKTYASGPRILYRSLTQGALRVSDSVAAALLIR